MENHTRCSDTNDPIDSFKLPKGKAGVSILWPNAWTNSIKKLKDGNERVIAILITASQELCIINAYMPTCNTDSQFEYTECLDIIYDIIQKYQETHKVILCGDLNGTLLSTRNNKHDKMLKNFVAEMGLSTGQDICEKHTFFHHAWSSSSQIDYILVQDKKLVLNYTIDEKSSINLSAHTSVRVITTIDIPAKVKSANKNRKAKYKLQWDQMDTNQYNRLIQQDITAIVDENNINTQVDILTNSLVRAGNITIPTKLLQLKGPKWKASPEVQILIKSCRNIYKQWQEAGKQKEHPLATTLKLEKRKLRSKVRMEQAVSRQSLYQQIMDNPNTQLFYRLINRNRSSQQTSTNCLKINGELNFIPEDQRRSFASYYEDLSVPKEELFDNNYLNLCKIRQQLYEQAMDQSTVEPELFTDTEVMKAIDELNTKKSADEFGISAEHLKYSKTTITPALTSIFNNILLNKAVPTAFTFGLLTPVLKKQKDPTIMGNYRGITVTATIGKTFEYAFIGKLNLKSKTLLQFGFTEGLSPIMSSLLISEARYEIKKSTEKFYISVLDVQSAFDVVQHIILMDKAIDQNIHPTYWKILTELYNGLSSKVKWLDGVSESFTIKQGVRQGGILSTHLYKIFVQDLLVELEQNSLGYHLGDIYIGAPTCADDIAFISNNEHELQIMLNVIDRYAKEHHYKIHPTKTEIIDCSKIKTDYNWTMDGKKVKTTDCSEHLGVKRTDGSENNFNVKDRIQTARRTRYALMGSGVHGTNGLNPEISYQIYRTYVIPRLIYGLEVLPLTKSNLEDLEKFHRKNLRHLQSLPERTSNAAVLLFLGALPIEAEIHKRQLSLLYSIITCDNTKIKDVMNRQIATNFDNKKSFFSKILNILELYSLPSINILQNSTPKKNAWKEEINRQIHKFWNDKLKSDAFNKTSLKYVCIDNLEIGKTAHVWKLKNQPRIEIRKSIVKSRMMTGTYILQSDKHKFTHFSTEATCQLCHTESEDIVHMITTCPVLSTIREKYFIDIKKVILDSCGPAKWNTYCNNKMEITRLILDWSNFKESLSIGMELAEKLEQKARNLLFQLHIKRIEILDARNIK